jgi:hypothetical protein
MNLTAAGSSAIVVPFSPNQPAATSAPVRDREAARRFLHLLDSSAADFTFQTFDDDRRNGHDVNASLARNTTDRAEILRLYELGAGVYVTINETDLTGRKSENIKRLRAVWQEDDEGHGGPFPLEPSLVVESSLGHFHRYWFVADHWPADEQGRADFAAVMERMVASYASDKNAKDISRVLRLPGFLHRKDPAQRHMVCIIRDGGRRYTREEILRAFPPVEREQTRRNEWRAADRDEERIADALRAIPADDRDVWLQVGMALKDELGDSGRSIWDHWAATCREKFKDRDQERTWRSFRRNGIGIGTLFYHAQRHGWSPPRRDARNGAGTASVASVASVASDTWPQMDEAAYYGLAGDVVRVIGPDSESDPVAILAQYLTAFGNIVGSTSHFLIESDQHTANLFVALVGVSAKGRKGTSGGRVRAVAKIADQTWFMERTASGLSSGEGLIYAVRNPISKWNAKEKVEEIVDPGVIDKRLMAIEAEFAGALAAMERHGNNLSPVIRSAWDGHRLQTLTKNSPLKADGAHISIVAHITETEARARLTRTDLANGFANRFLFFLVRRSKFLAHGGNLDEAKLQELGERTRGAVESARRLGRITMTAAAAQAWEAAYPDLSAERPGLLGAVIARAEAQVIRLALVYALLDGVHQIDVVHLEAAMAVWAYCEESATHIFGDSLGDPVADEILLALRRSGSMTRTDIHHLFGRHRSADQIGIALTLLLKTGRAKFETRQTGGRPVETWSPI